MKIQIRSVGSFLLAVILTAGVARAEGGELSCSVSGALVDMTTAPATVNSDFVPAQSFQSFPTEGTELVAQSNWLKFGNGSYRAAFRWNSLQNTLHTEIQKSEGTPGDWGVAVVILAQTDGPVDLRQAGAVKPWSFDYNIDLAPPMQKIGTVHAKCWSSSSVSSAASPQSSTKKSKSSNGRAIGSEGAVSNSNARPAP